MKLLLIRHGETDTNVKQLTHKRGAGEGLNSHGKEQARHLVDECKANGVQAIYSSPELRAIETAEIIGHGLSIKPTVVTNLSERHWGEWDGEPWKDIVSHLDKLSLEERYKLVPPGGESWQQMEERLVESIKSIQAKGETAAVVTHAGALRALLPVLRKESLDKSLGYELENGSVTIIET